MNPPPLLKTFTAILLIPVNIASGFIRFIKRLRTNPPGFIGFLGLVAYFILTFIMPHFVEFDDKAKLDEIVGPIGSRIQLAVHPDNVHLRTFEDLAGRTVGVVSQTGGPILIEPYADTLTVKTYRWSSRRAGPGIPASLVDVANKEIDATLIFSKSVTEFIHEQEDAELKALFDEHIIISNPGLGPPHLLGTDTQGRDIATHIVHGGRILILTAIVGAAISTFIALFFGAISALLGGFVDIALTALTNLILAIPQLVLLIVLAGLIIENRERFNALMQSLGIDNNLFLGILIGLLSWPLLMRSVRSQVLSLRERDFIEAARSLGLSANHIMFREILPNIISFVMINFIFSITFTMYAVVGLVVLGLAPINDYTWGVMLYFGRARGVLFNPDGVSMALSPILAIAFFQVCLVFFARALEELFDPRLRTAF